MHAAFKDGLDDLQLSLPWLSWAGGTFHGNWAQCFSPACAGLLVTSTTGTWSIRRGRATSGSLGLCWALRRIYFKHFSLLGCIRSRAYEK